MTTTGVWEISVIGLIKVGGPLMAPIILCSLFALSFVIEKMWYFQSIKTDASELKENIFDLLKNNKIKEAIQICDQNSSPVAKILRAGLVKFGSSRDEIKENMEDASLYEIPKLESRFGILSTIAHISPLLGLLGTVVGMTSCFYTIQIRAAALNPVTPGDLAGGIGQALITTVAGLLVAIPTYVIYNFLVCRVNHIVLEMERAATELVNYMTQITNSPSH